MGFTGWQCRSTSPKKTSPDDVRIGTIQAAYRSTVAGWTTPLLLIIDLRLYSNACHSRLTAFTHFRDVGEHKRRNEKNLISKGKTGWRWLGVAGSHNGRRGNRTNANTSEKNEVDGSVVLSNSIPSDLELLPASIEKRLSDLIGELYKAIENRAPKSISGKHNQ